MIVDEYSILGEFGDSSLQRQRCTRSAKYNHTLKLQVRRGKGMHNKNMIITTQTKKWMVFIHEVLNAPETDML